MWEIEQTPSVVLRPYVELLAAIDGANEDIAQENERRSKQKDAKSFLRRITLAD